MSYHRTAAWLGVDDWDDYDNKGNPTMVVEDEGLMQPIGFVWFHKPHYIVQAPSRKY